MNEDDFYKKYKVLLPESLQEMYLNKICAKDIHGNKLPEFLIKPEFGYPYPYDWFSNPICTSARFSTMEEFLEIPWVKECTTWKGFVRFVRYYDHKRRKSSDFFASLFRHKIFAQCNNKYYEVGTVIYPSARWRSITEDLPTSDFRRPYKRKSKT